MSHAAHTIGGTITAIYDTVIDEGRRVDALGAVAECAGVGAAGYMLVDRYSDKVRMSVYPGARSSNALKYQDHYYAIDPYRAARQRAETGSWMRVSEMFPGRFLERNEWYNDFLLAGGVSDILGGKLHESASHIFLIGLYRETGNHAAFPRDTEALKLLSVHLGNAARLHAALLDVGLDAALNYEAVDRLQTGMIFADESARIVWLNRTAEEYMRRGDGIFGNGGRVTTRRLGEAARLARLIAAATARPPSGGCMLVRREGGKLPYVVRVGPIGVALEKFDRPTAMIAITSPGDAQASPEDVSQLFGLSTAESHLAAAIAQGQQPAEYALAHRVQISTVRTQLSAVFRKLNAKRQSDVVRMLSHIPPAHSAGRT